MPNSFEIFAIVTIIVATVLGGVMPLRGRVEGKDRFPLGEAFSSGVFLALALAMMLPASFQLFQRALPHADEPVASLIAIAALLALLGVSHFVRHLEQDLEEDAEAGANPLVPVLMTVMIAIPSFFMGAALGVSDTRQATLILIAILLHKSSAAFALMLKLSDSSLPVSRVRLVFALFVLATPAGIAFGSAAGGQLGEESLLLARGTVLAMAAGTFLFMGTLNDLQSAPLIKRCGHWRGFAAMLAGLLVTLCARLLIGEAHSLG
jgi:zinc transporter ZupT